MAEISIIVPVYNVEKYLFKCVESLINQSFKDIEIILVDDGSTDNSLNICNEYAAKDKRIKVISQKNAGPSVARNNALQLATGKYIGFVDSDDYIATDTYEKALKYMSEDVSLVVWGVNVISDENLPYIKWFENEYFGLKHSELQNVDDNILFSTAVVPWNKLYRTSIIKSHNITFPEGKLYEDNAFWWKYIMCCDKIYFLNEKLHFYNMRSSSLRGEVIAKKQECEKDRIFMVQDVYDFCVRENILSDYWKLTLDKLFLKSFVDAYEETNDKISLTLYSKNIADKMNVQSSFDNKVVEFYNSLKKKCEYLSQINDSIDEKINFLKNQDLSAQEILKLSEQIKINYPKIKENDINNIVTSYNSSVDTFSLLINDYMKKINLSEEYKYFQNVANVLPVQEKLTLSLDKIKIMQEFLSKLFKKGFADELITFANFVLILYPQFYDAIRMIGDAYMFLKKDSDKAFYYYNQYVQFIKNNDSVYDVMSDICASKEDVFHQIIYKQKAMKIRSQEV